MTDTKRPHEYDENIGASSPDGDPTRSKTDHPNGATRDAASGADQIDKTTAVPGATGHEDAIGGAQADQ